MLTLTSPEIEAYCKAHSRSEDPLLIELVRVTREKTAAPQMQIGSLEGAFLHLLLKISGAKQALELGTFTGYSSLVIAGALPADGTLITCDVDERATAIAKEFWQKSPVGKKISLRLGPAMETLATLTPESLDFIFIDADKNNYPAYWEKSLPLLRQGGIIAVDNTLWSGRILAPTDPRDIAIDSLNKMAASDRRVDSCLIPIRDGILVARKI